MSNTTIPTIDDLDAEWFTTALRSSGAISASQAVSSVELARFGDGESMMSALYRAHLSYSSGEGPATVVVKLASDSERQRMIAGMFGFYHREVLYYQEFVSAARARVPACHHAAIDPEQPLFVIVMEDIAGGRIVDQVDGLQLDDAMVAMDALADFQAPTWGTDLSSSAHVFLPFDSEPLQMIIPDAFSNDWVQVKEILDGELSPEVIELCDRFRDICPDVLRAMNATDCLIHGDLRADNIMYDEDGAALIYDFQLCAIAQGAVDVAYVIGQSVADEVAAEHSASLFRRYVERLATHGITIDDDEAQAAYDAALIFFLQIPFSLLVGDEVHERGARLSRAALRRSNAEILRRGAHTRFS